MTRKQKLIRQVLKIYLGHQPTAAEKLGVTQASISRYAAGKSDPMQSVVLLARRIVTDAGRTPAG